MRLPLLTGDFRLGSDPDLRFTPGGKAVATISLIATESKKVDGGWEDGDSTPWITATAWEREAEAWAENLRSGMLVHVTGSLFVRTYEKQDGSKGQSIELKWVSLGIVPRGPQVDRTNEPGGADDPWATPRSGVVGAGTPSQAWGASNDEPPF